MKVAIVGDLDVGKSSLVSRWLYRNKEPNCDHTIGVDITTTTIHLHNKPHRLKIFDLCGNSGYDKLYDTYLFNAACCVVVYDVTKYKTWVRATKLVDKIIGIHSDNYPIILVGNKIDDIVHRRVPSCKALGFVKGKYNTFFIEVSAKNGANTKECLKMVASEAARKNIVVSMDPVKDECSNSSCSIV